MLSHHISDVVAPVQYYGIHVHTEGVYFLVNGSPNNNIYHMDVFVAAHNGHM